MTTLLSLWLLAALIFHASRTIAATAEDWRSRSIYQVLTDRFATMEDNPPICDTSAKQYCGGSYRGLLNKLDYIQSMGFDAVWISPVVENIEGFAAPNGAGYHGYWAKNITNLNPHFGTKDDLLLLSQELHKRSMYLMVDVVANHLASFGLPNTTTLENDFGPFNATEHFHPQCFVRNYDNQTDSEQCWLGDSTVPLVDLDTESPYVVQTLQSWVQNLVADYHIDGLRVDTVKHVRKDFWKPFAQAAGVYCVGEVLHNDTQYIAQYTNEMDAILDYPSWFALMNAFSTPQGDLNRLVEVAHQSQSRYKNGLYSTASFVSNHDQARIGNKTSDLSLVKNAVTWTFVGDGIPILYYGTEQNYQGGEDPMNRESLWNTEYLETGEMYAFVRMLNAARRIAGRHSSAFYHSPMHVAINSPSVISVSKPPMLAVLSNTGSSGSVTYEISGSDSRYPPSTVLVDVFSSCRTTKTDITGAVSSTISNGHPSLYLPQDVVAGSGLCSNTSFALASGASHIIGLVTISTWIAAAAAVLGGLLWS